MEGVRGKTANSFRKWYGPLKSSKESEEKVVTPLSSRRGRSGFSDPFSSTLDVTLFDLEEPPEPEPEKEKEKEKEKDKDKDNITHHDETSHEGNLKKEEREEGPCLGRVPDESPADSEYEEAVKEESFVNSSEHESVSSRGSNCSSDRDSQASSSSPIQWRDFFRVFKKGPSTRLQKIPLKKSVPRLTRRKSKRIRESLIPSLTSSLDGDLCYLKPSWKNFSLADLQAATNNFSQECLIGEGGYAEVYKGHMEDGQIVAIKRLTRGSPEEMTIDFLSELGIIVHVDHPNIAKLIGYGVEGGMHLVLELSANGSLSDILYGPKEKLDWPIRYRIALGTAEGIYYLHEGCQRRIIHKDIKASNILLTRNFEAQISDFGLAKWLPEQWSHHTVSKIEGTFGYLPPEFFMHGIVDEKTDVYAYGVLLLELITGKQALSSSQQSLVMWAKPFLMQGKTKELVDPTMADAYDLDEMDRLACTAYMCIDPSSAQRPQMSQVVQILKGDEHSLEDVRQQRKSKLQRTYSVEIFDAEEYNSTKYLSKHMEVMLANSNAPSPVPSPSPAAATTSSNDAEDGVVVAAKNNLNDLNEQMEVLLARTESQSKNQSPRFS